MKAGGSKGGKISSRGKKKQSNKAKELIPKAYKESKQTRDLRAKAVNTNAKYIDIADKLVNDNPEMAEEVASGNMTLTQVSRKLKEKKREDPRKKNAKKVKKNRDINEIVAEGVKFATILIDPPWDLKDEGDVNQMGRAKADYATLSYEKLLKWPVGSFADKDCHVYCWVTNRSMPKVFSLIEQWGFRYITLLTWPKPSFGLGNYFRGQTEHIAFGVKGSQMLKRKDVGTLLPTWPRGKQHSSKPTEIYELIESCSPCPYLEIFGRNKRDGWTIIGEDGING